jgi:tol-pal system protein YbgF
MFNRRTFWGVFCFIVVVTGPGTSQAQSYVDRNAAAMEVRLQQLESQLRNLTGKIEEQNYKIRQLEEELARATSDLALRVRDLEGGASAPSQGHTAQQTSSGAAPLPSAYKNEDYQGGGSQYMTQPSQGSEPFQYQPPSNLGTMGGGAAPADSAATQYEKAFALLKASDFAGAEIEFSRFMGAYPDHVLFSNAKYWFGETFYVRGNYEKAARIFAEGYQKYPKGAKAADNLLKLGMALVGLGKKEDACVALKQLEKEYAGASGPILRRGKQEMAKLRCK